MINKENGRYFFQNICFYLENKTIKPIKMQKTVKLIKSVRKKSKS